MIRRGLRAALLGAIIGMSVVGCSDGGASRVTPPVPVATGSTPATARMQLTIPARINVAAAHRAPQYVSPATLSGVVTITASSSGPHTYYVDLSNSSSICVATAQGARACTIAVPAAIGTNTATLTLYDGSNNGSSPSGAALSAASNFQFSVSEGTNVVTVPLVLGGIPTSVTVTQGSAPSAYQSGNGSLILTALDAGGNTIVGPGSFVDATGTAQSFTLASQSSNISLSLDGGTTLSSSVTITSPTQSITVVRAGAPILGAEIAITAPPSVTSPPADAYVQIAYTPSQVDIVPTTISASGTLNEGVSGYVGGAGGSGNVIAYVTNGGSVVGCTFPGAISDAVPLTSSLAWFDAASNIYTSPVSDTSGATGCNINNASINSNNAVTHAYGTSGSLAGFIFAIQTNGSTCTQYYQAPFGGPYGPLDSFSTCTVAWDLSLDYGVSSTQTAAFGYRNPSGDAVGSFTDTSGTIALSSNFGSIGTLGGVAIRDGIVDVVNTASGALLRYNPTTHLTTTVPIAGISPGCLYSGVTSPRTFVIGDDGLGYLAVGGTCPTAQQGLLVFDLQTGATIALLLPGTPVISVATDQRGHIYFDQAGSLYRYPSAASVGTAALHRRTR